MEWQPIETAPREDADFDRIYGADPLRPRTVLVGRLPGPSGIGVIPGVACEAELRNGEWQKPTHPDWRHAFGDWVTIVDPTHWMPLPEPPK